MTNSLFFNLVVQFGTDGSACFLFDDVSKTRFDNIFLVENRSGDPFLVINGNENVLNVIQTNVEEILDGISLPTRPSGNFLELTGDFNEIIGLEADTTGERGTFAVRVEGDYNVVQGTTIGIRNGDGLVVHGSHNRFTLDLINATGMGLVFESGVNNSIVDKTFAAPMSSATCIDVESNDNFVEGNNVEDCENAITVTFGSIGNNLLRNIGNPASSMLLDENPDCGDNIWLDNIGTATDECVLTMATESPTASPTTGTEGPTPTLLSNVFSVLFVFVVLVLTIFGIAVQFL